MKKRGFLIIVLLIIVCMVVAMFFLNIETEEEGDFLNNLKDFFSFDWLFKNIASGYGYGSETCFDGIMNQDEINIDCGGVCEPCKNILPRDEVGRGGGCLEVWECGEWGDCSDNEIRTRECIEHTGCVLYFHKPLTNISCNETCFDGIINQDEKEVDCGGICEPCLEFGFPKFEKGFSWFIVVLLTLLIATLLILFVIWRPDKKKGRIKRKKKKKHKSRVKT